jgi:hypothetical protein
MRNRVEFIDLNNVEPRRTAMKKSRRHIRFGLSLSLALVLFLAFFNPAFSQATPASIVFTSVNADDTFPEIRVQLRVLDTNNSFVQGLNADQFSIREDGNPLPIEDVTSAALPLNMHVVFVVDELAIGSRISVVREAIQSFALNQMREGDSVIVLAATIRSETNVLVPLTNNPEEVISGVQEENYSPTSASGTDILVTVNQGLAELSALNENTVGLNKIVVFSVSVNNQRDLDGTIAKANQLSIPIHTVLLGSSDANGALGRLTRETEAGTGVISVDDFDTLDSVLDPQRSVDQYLIVYRSQVNQPGRHEIVVSVNGSISKSAVFTLDQLEPPRVLITHPPSGTEIIRAETLFSQNSDLVQPTEQTVAVEINWPDGHPREIIHDKTILVVNGRAIGTATAIRNNGEDPVLLEFTWDLRPEQTPGVTSISVVVETEDELGLKSRSEPLPVTVEYIVFSGENICPPLISEYIPGLCSNWNLVIPLASLAVAVIALVLVIVYLRRNPKVQQKVKERLLTIVPGGAEKLETRIVGKDESAKAVVIVIGGNAGGKQTEFPLNATTTIGRSGDHAKLVLQGDKENSPISRLHCTILEKDGVFELRDESSANGTHLNDLRLMPGKPHRLNDGDTIEIAKVLDGGVKFKFQLAQRPGYLKTRIVEPPPNKPDDKDTPDGYTPTKLMN